MVEGLASLKRKMTVTIPAAVRTAVMLAMEKSAAEIVAMAKSLVPKDSGALRDSIGWTWGEAPKGSIVIATIRPAKAGTLRLTIFAGNEDAFWARWVEFGTQPHSLASGADSTVKSVHQERLARSGTPHPGARANPFFFVSYRFNAKKAKGRMTRAIRKALKDGAK